MRIDLADSLIDRAQDEMRARRRHMGGYRSPCMDHPTLFDPQDGESRESWAQFSRRAAVATELCVTTCRILPECQRLARLIDPEGVMAGKIYVQDEKGGGNATAKT